MFLHAGFGVSQQEAKPTKMITFTVHIWSGSKLNKLVFSIYRVFPLFSDDHVSLPSQNAKKG